MRRRVYARECECAPPVAVVGFVLQVPRVLPAVVRLPASPGACGRFLAQLQRHAAPVRSSPPMNRFHLSRTGVAFAPGEAHCSWLRSAAARAQSVASPWTRMLTGSTLLAALAQSSCVSSPPIQSHQSPVPFQRWQPSRRWQHRYRIQRCCQPVWFAAVTTSCELHAGIGAVHPWNRQKRTASRHCTRRHGQQRRNCLEARRRPTSSRTA